MVDRKQRVIRNDANRRDYVLRGLGSNDDTLLEENQAKDHVSCSDFLAPC